MFHLENRGTYGFLFVIISVLVGRVCGFIYTDSGLCTFYFQVECSVTYIKGVEESITVNYNVVFFITCTV